MLSEDSLRHDLQVAMRARDMCTVYVLRGLLAAIVNRKIEEKVAELNDREIAVLVQREAKKREEAEAFARRAARAELVEQNAAERAILARYLPRALDDAELTHLFGCWLAEGLTGMGPLMARLKERHAGQYDGKRASEIARSMLAAQ
jgi:uncharacterized protein YqeY